MYDSYLNEFNVPIQKKLEHLAEVLVPDTFKETAPQFYELVKSFLVNIQHIQDSVNLKHIDLIDPERIQNDDILQLYYETYLAAIEFDETFDLKASIDLLKVSKELSERKGTVYLYSFLINLLVFVVPGIKNYFTDIEVLLNDPDVDDDTKELLREDYENLLRFDRKKTVTNITEHNAFEYSIKSEFKAQLFDKMIKPFCHPAGWHITYSELLSRFFVEIQKSKELFRLIQTFRLPDTFNTNDAPFNANPGDNIPVLQFYQEYPLGDEEDYLTIKAHITDSENLYIKDGKVYYDFVQLTVPKYEDHREFTSYGDDEIIKTDIRYVESEWDFPSALYSANMVYTANFGAMKANVGMISAWYNKLITYKTIIQNDIVFGRSYNENCQ